MTAPAGARFVTGLTDDQLAAFESMASDLMVEILTQVADHYADLLVDRARAAGAVVAAAGESGDGAYVDPEDLAGAAGATSDAIAQTMLPLVAEAYLSGAGALRANMIDAANVTLPPVRSIDAVNYLAGAANTFDGIGDDLWRAIRTELAAGFDAGEDIPQLADRVRAAGGVTARTATLTARTSVIDAANMGSISTARASGLQMEKEWMATPDRRTRPTHRAAGGLLTGMPQRVDLNGKFVVGGYECDRPGDPMLPAQERNLCRCTVGYVIPDESDRPVAPAPPTIPTQRQRAVRPAAAAPDVDPATKMTVSQLKAAAQMHDNLYRTQFYRLLSGKTKPQIVATLRDLERAHMTRISGLPDWKPPRVVTPAVQPAASAQSATVLTGNPAGGAWRSLLVGQTPAEGVRVRDLRVTYSYQGEYRVANGTAWRDADGVAYLVEHGEFETGAQWVTDALNKMRDAHRQIPAADRANKSYAWLLDRNPSDSYWETEYKSPGFRSWATAGDGAVTPWSRGFYGGSDGSGRFVALLRHETGHNLDDAIGRTTNGSQSQAWKTAVADDATGSPRVTDLRERAPEHPITQAADAGKGFPDGVTTYGKSSTAEDFAEAARLYSVGPLGTGRLAGFDAPVEVYFRDIFPHRAAILDGVFPDLAKVQREAIRARAASLAPKPVGAENAAKRAAARTRMSAIEKATLRADALNEIDEVFGVSANALLLRNRLDYFADKKIITRAEATALARAASEGRPKLTAALGRLATKSKISLTSERAGDLVDFDADRMQSVDAGRHHAGQVRVMRGGASVDYDGERIQLDKIIVRRTTPEELAGAREAKVAPSRQLAGFVTTVERSALGMSDAEIRTTLGRFNLPDATRKAIEGAIGDPLRLKRVLASELRKAKIRTDAKTPAGGVDFDPDLMVSSAGSLARGTKVRVVNRGFMVDVDGERVVLVKAYVEPLAPPKPKAAKVPKAERVGNAVTNIHAAMSVDDGLAQLAGLTLAELREVAKRSLVHLPARTTTDAAKRDIVNAVVQRRLSSAAIRGVPPQAGRVPTASEVEAAFPPRAPKVAKATAPKAAKATAPKAAKVAAPKAAPRVERVDTAVVGIHAAMTVDGGLARLAGLTLAELREVARRSLVHLPAGATIDTAKREIISAVVQRRLSSAAIRGVPPQAGRVPTASEVDAAFPPRTPKVAKAPAYTPPASVSDPRADFARNLAASAKGAKALQAATVRAGWRGNERTFAGLDSLSPGDKRRISASIVQYVRSGFQDVNSWLRTGKRKIVGSLANTDDEVRGMIRDLEQAFDMSRLADSVTVYRGLETGEGIFGPRSTWPDDMSGAEWTDVAMFSTSARRSVAEFFGNVQLRLVVPRGTRALTLSDMNDEAEILLPPGTKFRVVRDRGTSKDGKRMLDVEIVSSP